MVIGALPMVRGSLPTAPCDYGQWATLMAWEISAMVRFSKLRSLGQKERVNELKTSLAVTAAGTALLGSAENCAVCR